ncbi:MAG: chromosome partitioning protein ParA, partial [Limnospira sp. PMC 1249.20]|nr:chromosome partitioning protein ParA [Limnospira sp. PMC 1249.20]
PDLSWNNQIKSSPYMAWAFRDWANYRLYRSQLEQTEGVLEKTHTQLQKTESVLQEYHNRLTGLRSQFSQVQEELEQA